MLEQNKDQEEITDDEPLSSYLIAAPMKNDIGEHNSFINVIIHSLRYIPEILKYFIETDLSDEEQYNMLIEIQRLLDKYNKLTSILYCPKISRNLRSLNILQLRRELEYLFSKEQLFKVQTTGDPVDVFFVLLSGIHLYCNNRPSLKEIDDSDCHAECVVHSTLMLYLVEQQECPRCLKKSDIQKFPSNTYYYELKVDYIIKKTEKLQYLNNFKGKLFQYSKEETGITEEECPQHECRDSHCKMQKNVILVKANKYICFCLIWPELNPKLTDMCKVYFSIPEIFSNEEIFNIYDEEHKKKYELYGIVCYSNVHYICFFISQLKNEVEKYWILHSDMEIVKLPMWKDVITYCIMNSYYPMMLHYREVPSKPDMSIRCDLVDGDYFQMLNHSLKVDLENAITYANEINIKNKIRPSTHLTKSQDKNLLQVLDKLKVDKLPQRTKRLSSDFQDGDEDLVNFTDETKNYSSKGETGETEEAIPLKARGDLKQEQYQEIDIQTLQSETFRYSPYQREGDWFCKTENCNNLNNKNTFQCLKCKIINMVKFQEMEGEKEKQFKAKFETSFSQNVMLSNKYKSVKTKVYCASQIKQTNSKLCINCNSPFKQKCNCSVLKSLAQSFRKLQNSENDNDKNKDEAINAKPNQLLDLKTISRYENSGWVCFHCSSYNIVGFDYCKECKKNKAILS